jgi:ABC-type sulfate transport system permease component
MVLPFYGITFLWYYLFMVLPFYGTPRKYFTAKWASFWGCILQDISLLSIYKYSSKISLVILALAQLK